MNILAAMLADAAVVERGKLYIHGGGWDTIFAAATPTGHPTMALALLFKVEYSEALEDIPVSIELHDEDNNLVGPKIEAKFNVGHPAGSKPGAPILVPQAITFTMLQLPKIGGYSFRVSSAGKELTSVQFRVAPLATSMLAYGLQSPPG